MWKHIAQLWNPMRVWLRRQDPPRQRFTILPFIILTSALILHPVETYPPSGSDEFLSSATIRIDLSLSGGPVLADTVVGRARVSRGDPFDPGDGHNVIETEIVSLELHGMTPLGPITVRESPIRDSVGRVRQQTAGVSFPADSFFDLFVEIDTPFGTLSNLKPIRLQATIDQLPPLHASYTPPAFVGVALYLNSRQVGVLTHASHFVGQKPSFSVAPDGPSGLVPAEIHDVPTAPRIPPAALGLTKRDDLDALSYGIDFISYNSSVNFSVDAKAVGRSGSAVATEASAGEAHGDEFRLSPSLPVGGSNVQVLDENGDTAPPFPLLISDDVDALTEPPASFVDRDGDGVPESPVYFSLAAGSPTLATIGADPADILVSVGGAAPTVFIPRADLGLRAGDDVDALCLDITTRIVLYSLAPGSPTLVLVGAGPAALFGGFALPLPTPPFVFAPPSVLGLLRTDNLNALKCSMPEVDHFKHSLAEMTLELPGRQETIVLSGPTTVSVAIGPEGGATQDQDSDGLEEVQTEIVSMQLAGSSSLGAVSVTAGWAHQQDPSQGSFGFIEESTNNTPGILDLPPFTDGGTADSFFDVLFEIDIAGQVLHNINPKRMRTTITHKPPGRGETYENHDRTELYDQNDNPTGILVTGARHTPNPRRTVQDAVPAQAEVTLNTGTITETVPLAGWATVLHFTGPNGLARDWDSDGQDQIATEIVQMELRGHSADLGMITLRLRDDNLSPFLPSLGETEEVTDHNRGVLDVAPFAETGMIDSFFDVFVELSLPGGLGASAEGGTVFHNMLPMRLQGRSDVFPAGAGDDLRSRNRVALVDESDQPTGMSIEALSYSVIRGNLLYLPTISMRNAP